MTLVAEVSRYLNLSPLGVEELLDATKEGTGELVAMTNEFNELLYDEIIPRLFRQLYDLDESQQTEEHEVDLIKLPPNGYYEVTAVKDKIVRMGDVQINDEERTKSFHLDTYCFDSGSESWLFWDLLREQRVKKIYFTGMLTHGQSDFFIQYIDPDSRTVRSYYPDFVFLREEPDGTEKYGRYIRRKSPVDRRSENSKRKVKSATALGTTGDIVMVEATSLPTGATCTMALE